MSVMNKPTTGWKPVEIEFDNVLVISSDMLAKEFEEQGISLEISMVYSDPVVTEEPTPSHSYGYNSTPKEEPIARGYMAIAIYWKGRELTKLDVRKVQSYTALKERIDTELLKAKEKIKFEFEEKQKELNDLQSQMQALGL